MRTLIAVILTAIMLVGCLYEYQPRREIISDRDQQQAVPVAVNTPPSEPKADIIPGLIDSNYRIRPFSRYNKQQVEQLQIGLKNKRFYYGEIDGIYGPNTMAALQRFRNYNRLTVTGDPSVAEISMLFSE